MMPVPVSGNVYIDHLKLRREAYQELITSVGVFLRQFGEAGVSGICAGLDNLLIGSIDREITQIQMAQSCAPARIVVTPEALVEAANHRDTVEQQLRALDGFVSECPPKQGDFINAQLRPQLEEQLRYANERLGLLQRHLEEQDPAAGTESSTATEAGSQTKGESD